jgi:hypothetical protein
MKKKKKKNRIFKRNQFYLKTLVLLREIIRPNALLDYNEENGRLNNKIV